MLLSICRCWCWSSNFSKIQFYEMARADNIQLLPKTKQSFIMITTITILIRRITTIIRWIINDWSCWCKPASPDVYKYFWIRSSNLPVISDKFKPASHPGDFRWHCKVPSQTSSAIWSSFLHVWSSMYIFCGIAPYITDFQSHNHDLRVGEDDGNCHNSGGGGDLNDDDLIMTLITMTIVMMIMTIIIIMMMRTLMMIMAANRHYWRWWWYHILGLISNLNISPSVLQIDTSRIWSVEHCKMHIYVHLLHNRNLVREKHNTLSQYNTFSIGKLVTSTQVCVCKIHENQNVRV